MMYLETLSLIKIASCRLRVKLLIASYVKLNVDPIEEQGGWWSGKSKTDHLVFGYLVSLYN